jgi:adenylate cyclase
VDPNANPVVHGTAQRMRISLRSAIILFTIGFGLLLTGTLATYNYHRSSEVALDVAESLIEQAGGNVSLRARLLAQPFDFLIDHVQLLPGAAARPQDFTHPLLPALLDILDNNPQIYSTYFGYDDGGFFQIISLVNRPKAIAKIGAPAGTRFALRHITAQAGQRVERWRHLDRERRAIATSAPKPARYDPRTRPWYVSASRMDSPQRTKLYVFSSTQDLGLTVSRRLSGSMPVVFGVDLTLESLSRFLAEEKIGPSGLLFMFDSDGGLIGHPDAARLTRTAADQQGGQPLERASVEALGDPVALAAFKAFTESGKTPVPLRRMKIGGMDYLLQVRGVDELGADNYMALVARVDDFTGPVARTRNHSLLFALGLILVVIPAVGLAAGCFSVGLCRLAEEADRIRTLNLDACEPLCSRINELEHLDNAVASMRSALKSFSSYLPRSLVKQFIDTGLDPVLGGERRDITLLFTDVENFTPLAEHLPPEELMQAMSEYFQVVSQAILERGGTIDKFIGDAVMAFWNAPFESDDHVERACVAALRLSRASEELNQRRQDSGLPLLRTRVGIHAGTAVVGNIGSADRMDYTALGANVNLASRLEGLNKFYATRILVSRTVRERAKKNFLFRSVDVVVPKGATDPLAVFELVGAMPQSPFPDVAAPRARLGFCSRWERAITLYRTVQWDKALAEFTALLETAPDDHLAGMYCTRTRRLLENKQGKDWKAVQRYQEK